MSLLPTSIFPPGSPRQLTGKDLAADYVGSLPKDEILSILDLGCGDGRGADFFASLGVAYDYNGLDIEGSPESKSRTREDGKFHYFDGVNIPFDSSSFDLIYSIQVFEHVRYPEPLLKEVFRVLKNGRAFIGSVSYLEPYHSYSFFNYTPWGWYTLLIEAGFKNIVFAPGISAQSLIGRSIDGNAAFAKYNSHFKSSPFNETVINRLDLTSNEKWDRMIQFCGHLSFLALK